MESLSTVAVWLAIAATVVASGLYWAHLLGLRLVMRRMATGVGDGPVVATIERNGANGWSDSAGRAATTVACVALALLVVALVARWRAVDHAPWSNMYEFTVAFAAGMLAFYLVFERAYTSANAGGGVSNPATEGPRISPGRPARTLGGIAVPVVFAMLAVAVAFFPDDVRPLVPALQNSDLLAIHVATMILAYAALSVSFASAVLYLVQGGTRNRFDRLPKARLLDEIGYKSVMAGFPLLAAGIALGAYWANSAWGRYWGWDPKESSALVTLLIYGVYLHAHSLRNWAGMRSAVVLVIGFLAVLFSYFVVNLWVSGLHSYAGV